MARPAGSGNVTVVFWQFRAAACTDRGRPARSVRGSLTVRPDALSILRSYNSGVTPPSDPRFKLFAPVRVRYADTDAMGVVYYANYLAFFETARMEYMRGIGCSYRDIEAMGLVAAVTAANCKYIAPARFDDLLSVYARVTRLGRASMTFAYEVWRHDEPQLLSIGDTNHACLNRETLRPAGLPATFREAVTRFEPADFTA